MKSFSRKIHIMIHGFPGWPNFPGFPKCVNAPYVNKSSFENGLAKCFLYKASVAQSSEHRQSRRQGLETPNALHVPSVMRLRDACACAILSLLLPKSKTNKRLILIYCPLFSYSSLYWKIV